MTRRNSDVSFWNTLFQIVVCNYKIPETKCTSVDYEKLDGEAMLVTDPYKLLTLPLWKIFLFANSLLYIAITFEPTMKFQNFF